MDQPNGKPNELGTALERIIAAFARINTALRSLLERLLRLSDEHATSSERREKEHEIVRSKVENLSQRVEYAITLIAESKGDIERVRDWTPIHGVPLQDPSAGSRSDKKNDSGALVAIARVAEKVPSSWVGWLLKLGVPAGLGAGALRFAQWLVTGH